MAEFNNFSFMNVNVIFGNVEITGWADGDDVVTIDFDTDQFTDMAGAQGDVIRTQTSDHRVTVTAKILQTSVSNAELTAIYNLDGETGTGIRAMIIDDKERGETYVINNAWIQKYPTVTRGQNPNSMDWVFRGDFMTPSVS